ncbi:MAG TPA: hypothetical protein VIK55_06630 [Paludibacter sp.]
MADEPISIIKDFIDSCEYKKEIHEAISYEKKLGYFIQTHLSTDIFTNTDNNLDELWNTQNPFINWVQSWMRKENFRSYMKFFRHPLPTASLIQDDIIPELKKVFDATNARYDYVFSSNAQKITSAKLLSKYSDYWKTEIFNLLINQHNSIIITDFVDKRNPYRFTIEIDDVKAIDKTESGAIKAIVFEGENDKGEERYYFYTDQFYSVYIENDQIFTLESEIPHDLGVCPADFVSVEPINTEKFVVRKSIFSNFVEKFENYVNYYTLQKMFIPSGMIPVITHYKQNNKPCERSFENGTRCIATETGGYLGGLNGVLGNKDSLVPCPVCNSKTIIQAGMVIGLPVPKFSDDGKAPFDLNANFVKFHYAPVEILTWVNDFVKEKYDEIKYGLVGKGTEQANGQAKNKDQIARGNQTLENTLIELSGKMSKLQTSLDSKLLKIAFGKSFKSNYIDKGTDFYLDTEFQLRDFLAIAVDTIDKENLISRINFSIYKNNPDALERSNLLYKLLPYSTLTDDQFITMTVDPKMKELRLNFKYYIDAFEAEFGELNVFFNEYFGENISMSNKLTVARELLIGKVNTFEPPAPEPIITPIDNPLMDPNKIMNTNLK